MKLLALDTATERCSAALWLDGEVATRDARVPRAHARLILPMVDELLAEAGLALSQLDGIGYGRGPGTFTGVRLAVAVTQGLAFGAGLAVAGISELAALAHAAWRSHGWDRVEACLDARMGEIYTGRFCVHAPGRMTVEAPERLCAPEALDPESGCAAAGPGWRVLIEAGRSPPPRLDADCLPGADDVAWLASTEFTAGRAVPAEAATPVYLRERVAQPPPRGRSEA